MAVRPLRATLKEVLVVDQAELIFTPAFNWGLTYTVAVKAALPTSSSGHGIGEYRYSGCTRLLRTR